MKKTIVLTILYFSFFLANGQDMKTGFAHLEAGEFAQAESFFEQVLEEYPDNKTALICYGRAVGLNGQPSKAKNIFSDLLKQYPNDIEVQLNYAESLLWGKQYGKAEKYYSTLAKQYPENFAVLLGYANTFSNLKKYAEATDYVNRALVVQPGNASAMTSKKYIRLGQAYSLSQQQEYKAAVELLKANLADFENDRQTLINLANIYILMKETDLASETYQTLATSPKDSLLALNGMALAAHIAGKNKLALQRSEKAISKLSATIDSTTTKSTKERFVQALIWNKHYSKAEDTIRSYQQQYGDQNWILSLKATLGMYRSDFSESIAAYNQILENDSASFDGNLGIGNAYYAVGKVDKAYSAADQTLEIFENQVDAQTFLNKLDRSFSPVVEERISLTSDNGKNQAISTKTQLLFPVSTKLSFSGAYLYREAKNKNTDEQATTHEFRVGVNYHLLPKVKLHAAGTVIDAKSFSHDYTSFSSELSAKMKLLKLQDLELGFKQDIQNYNADLVDRELKANHFYLNHNLGSNVGVGWFTQYFYTNQSDENVRNLLFTSLYYNILSKPVLKTGFNFQTIGFKEQRPTVYFSPEKFKVYELFLDFLKDENSIQDQSGLFYGLNAAAGYQFIEDGKKQFTHRVQVKLGYKASNRLLANFYGTQSNIASATAAGFSFTEVGLRLKWQISSSPIFNRKK